MQRITFGLSLDAPSFFEKEMVYFFGQNELLEWLERHLSLSWPSSNNDYLRVAFFQQAIQQFIEANPQVFFAESFRMDPFGSTEALLTYRDDLLLSGWSYEESPQAPPRIRDLTRLEHFISTYALEKGDRVANYLESGFADRFREVEAHIDTHPLPDVSITLIEPLELLPSWWQRLFARLTKYGIPVRYQDNPVHQAGDLSTLSEKLSSSIFVGDELHLKGDGSVQFWQVARDYDGLEQYALQAQTDSTRCLIIPPDVKLSDLIFASDGSPVLGNVSLSAARPSQQLIKLAHTFLWWPIDLTKVLEFLNLPYSPIDTGLAIRLAAALQDRPGFDNEAWQHVLDYYNSSDYESDYVAKIMAQYRFWFERKTYSLSGKVPKVELMAIYRYLSDWARMNITDQHEGPIYLGIYRQSKDFIELLESIDNQNLSLIEIERLIEVITQATPAKFKDREVGSADFTHNPGAIPSAYDEIVWFNFSERNPENTDNKWYSPEIDFLHQQNVQLWLADDVIRLRKWQYYRPIKMAEQRIVFVVPEKVAGQAVNLHPFYVELETLIKNIELVSFHFEKGQFPEGLPIRPTEQKKPKRDFQEGFSVQISPFDPKEIIHHFTVTQMDTFIYHPHSWVFRSRMALFGSSLFQLKNDAQIMGNIAHKLFDELFKLGKHEAEAHEIDEWFETSFTARVKREGIPLLQYGKEPDLASFRNKLQYSLHSFVAGIKQNGWRVVDAEATLEGKLGMVPIKGITDVVLERQGHYLIVDLKWGGKTFRKDLLKNKEDLQLMFYSMMYGDASRWWDACFYIIRDGVFVTRNPDLFSSSEIITSKEKETATEIYTDMESRLQKTYAWRVTQIQDGFLELRTDATIPELDALYGEALFDLLPMKNEANAFDDFGALLGMVE